MALDIIGQWTHQANVTYARKVGIIHRIQIWRITRADRGELLKSRLVRPYFDVFRCDKSGLKVIFTMLTHCHVPECNQKDVKSPTGEKASYFEFPNQPLLRNKWIHATQKRTDRLLETQKFALWLCILGEKI